MYNYPFIEQTEPPRPALETLPTMYDLPSEDPEEPGLPDEFHYLQPQLLSVTFCPSEYESNRLFTTGDLNLYYDPHHPQWQKRPDWFAVVGVPRLYNQQDLRLSYVVWQEGVSPSVVVEFLSPSTENEDLGKTNRGDNQPPTKWQVYEQILRIPYYAVFNRYSDRLQVFTLVSGQYQEVNYSDRVWMPTLNLGLGLWQGEYRGISRLWLRWYDAQDNWILTNTEQERQQKELAQRRADRLADRLRSLGINPDDLDIDNELP